jgi:hypothetical protein
MAGTVDDLQEALANAYTELTSDEWPTWGLLPHLLVLDFAVQWTMPDQPAAIYVICECE